MWLAPKLISQRTADSNFPANHGYNENDQDNENHLDNKNEGNYPANKYMFKVSFGVFMVLFEHISHLVLVLLMSISNM